MATSSQTVGPFFHFGLATNQPLGTLIRPGTPGEPIRLRVRVLDGDALPVPDALLELYQADAGGEYGRPSDAESFTGFGRLATDADGVCVFTTVRPGTVADGGGGLQAPHINVCLFARGLLRHLWTRIYFSGDAGLDTDPLLALVPESRRHTLMASPTADAWEITFRLQGEGETVFFDL